jgi:hypothetical protein
MNDTKSSRIDHDLMNLSGGAFDSLPQTVLPLEVFSVAPSAAPAQVAQPAADVWLTDTQAMPLVRPRHDSLSPTASPSVPPPPPSAPRVDARRNAGSRASRALGIAIAAGAFGFGIAGALLTFRGPAASAPASAPQAVVAAPAPQPVAAAPVEKKVEERAAPVEAKPVEAAKPKAIEPVAAVKAAAPAPRPVEPAVAKAPAPVAPVANAEPAAADTADLPMPVIPPLPPKPTVDINRAAVAVAIGGVSMKAASCREAGADPVAVPVTVIFAPNGHVTSAVINGGALAGTKEGACLAGMLRGATVPAFDGDSVTVTTTVHLR